MEEQTVLPQPFPYCNYRILCRFTIHDNARVGGHHEIPRPAKAVVQREEAGDVRVEARIHLQIV